MKDKEILPNTKADREENHDTGDAALDNPRNTDGIGTKELLVVSFGTSYNDNRRLTIGAIEGTLEKAFPDYSIRRAFTSGMIIRHIRRRDGVTIDNMKEALERAAANGVKTLILQPTHLMDGIEYHHVLEAVSDYAGRFEKIAIGDPLLTSEEDFQTLIRTITRITAEYNDGETAICFMGHGTEAAANAIYDKMQQLLADQGYRHYFIGTVESSPTLEHLLTAVQEGNYRRVVLQPLMIVAGDHANNDMASDEPDSWRSRFEAAGFEVCCVLEGLGSFPAVQQMFVEHARAAMEALKEM